MPEYNPETQKVVPRDSIILDPRRVARYLMAEHYDMVKITLEKIDRAIEAQTKPPRIPEPGLWAVVRDSYGVDYVRGVGGGDFRWQMLGETTDRGNCYVRWEDIESPLLVREGV